MSHVHEGGDHPHHHAFLSAHDMALERAALGVVPEGIPNGELDSKAPPRKSIPVGEGGRSLSMPVTVAHAHFQEDPNLPALGVVPVFPEAALAPLSAPETVPVFVPALAILAAPARAPPRA